jgi:hypothetical protein
VTSADVSAGESAAGTRAEPVSGDHENSRPESINALSTFFDTSMATPAPGPPVIRERRQF